MQPAATEKATGDDGRGFVPYDPGPNHETLETRYGIDVQAGQARTLQRLESEFGSDRVQRWADEGMPVAAMGKPRDMGVFLERGRIQAQLKVSNPDDPAEREAERVAEQVIGMSDARGEGFAPGGGEHPSGGGRSGSTLWPTGTTTTDRTPGIDESPRSGGTAAEQQAGESVERALASPSGGRTLTPGVRSFFEPRFGHDFGSVRIHTGREAARLGTSLDANAFVHGRDVYFASGQYRPDTLSGKALLAHELTHVVQQVGGRSATGPPAERVTLGRRSHISRSTSSASHTEEESPPSERGHELLDQGVRHFEAGEYRKAIILFERARQLVSKQYQENLLFNIGYCNLKLRRFATAITYFEQYINHPDPDEDEKVEARNLLEQARRGAGIPTDETETEATDAKTTEEIIERGRQLFEQGNRHFEAGEYRKAIILYERSRQLPDLPKRYHRNLLYNIGVSNLELRRFATAITYFEQYIDHPDPDEDEKVAARTLLERARRAAGIPADETGTESGPSQKFVSGDVVKTTDNLRIRAGPGLDQPIEETTPIGVAGDVLEGPVTADGHVWWRIGYHAGFTGWSAEPWLESKGNGQEKEDTALPEVHEEAPAAQEEQGETSAPLKLVDHEDGYIVFNRFAEREEVIEYLWGNNYTPRKDELWTRGSESGDELGLFEDIDNHWKLKERSVDAFENGQFYGAMLPLRRKEIRILVETSEQEGVGEGPTPEREGFRRFRIRMIAGGGGGLGPGGGPGGGVYSYELEELGQGGRNMFITFVGGGGSVGLPVGIYGPSTWTQFSTEIPMRLEDFEGPGGKMGFTVSPGPFVGGGWENLYFECPNLPGVEVVVEGWFAGAAAAAEGSWLGGHWELRGG